MAYDVRKICPDQTPLTEWLPMEDFVVLCIGVHNGAGQTCWVKAINLDPLPDGKYGSVWSIWPDVAEVGAGQPGDWHLANG